MFRISIEEEKENKTKIVEKLEKFLDKLEKVEPDSCLTDCVWIETGISIKAIHN